MILNDFHNKTQKPKTEVYERNFKFFNDDEFKTDLRGIPWENILAQDNLNASAALDVFYMKINRLLDEHAPIHKLSKREISLKLKPWITKDIHILMKLREKKFKFYCKENDINLKQNYHNDFKRLRNEVKSKLKNEKKRYYDSYFKRNSNDIKKVWNGIKSLVTLKSKSETSPKSLNIDENCVTNEKKILKLFIIFSLKLVLI